MPQPSLPGIDTPPPIHNTIIPPQMSSRAVRKALLQRELAALSQKPEGATTEHEDEDEEDTLPSPPQKQSLFALLGGEDGAGELEGGGEEGVGEETVKKPVAQKQGPPNTSSKKKKKKRKSKLTRLVQKEDEDEIDAALRVLNLQHKTTSTSDIRTEEAKRLSEILRVDPQNLDAANEMRQLFGRVALRSADGSVAVGRRGRAPATGRGLTGRRNAFMRAKEGWPVLGSGGLGMEIVATNSENVTEFKFVHTRPYQDIQRQFMMCVASIDPNRLVQLLQHNPCHISTLLQASEIFAQQGDHTTSGDLLERALFIFGRSLHSTFQSKMSEGNARLSFLHPENREFWLCCWRYLRNLQMRGTWRAAGEFARLLLAIDPEGDPYQIRLYIDFIALKARQPEYILALIEHPRFRERYASLPNMAYSTALAYKQLDQDAAAREYLAKAMTKFPWVVSRLYAELNIDTDLPPALWGVLPPEGDKLHPILAELYASRSKDLWKEPEATILLVDVASTIYNLPRKSLLKPPEENEIAEQEIIEGVSLDIARHILVTDIPSVTALLPRAFTRRESPGYDPLPPTNDIRSYSIDIPDTAPGAIEGAERVESGASAGLLREFLMSLFPHLDRAGGEMPSEEDIRRALRENGIDIEPGDLGFRAEGENEDEVDELVER